MKSILKGERNYILLLLLLGLLFILWGRMVTFEIKRGMHINNLDTVIKRVSCAESFGWQVDPGSEKCEKTEIPKEFSDVYENYNKLQKKCGFNLLRYRGKTVLKYTYIILNPPAETEDTFFLNILVFENTMIGGDVMTPALDGVMLPVIKNE